MQSDLVRQRLQKGRVVEQGVGSSSAQPPSPKHGWFAPPPSGQGWKRPPKPPMSALPAAPPKAFPELPPPPPVPDLAPALELVACPALTSDSSDSRSNVARPQPATTPSAQNPAVSATVRTEFRDESRIAPKHTTLFAEF